jgi:hypothetical protein
MSKKNRRAIMELTMVRRNCFLAFVLVTVFLAHEAYGQDSTLELVLDDSEILRDGVVAGELVLTNTGNESPRVYRGLSMKMGTLEYIIESPSKNTRVTVYPPGTYRTVQVLQLYPGEYVRQPICLLISQGTYLFNTVGTYRIKAVYRAKNPIESKWVEIQVREGSVSHEKYLASHRFMHLINAHEIDGGRWSLKESERISDYGDYSNEMAKLVIYQLGAGAVRQQILSIRSSDASEAVENARIGLSLAQQYGYGVQMWTTIVDLVNNPGKVRVNDSNKIVPRNSLYF